MIRTFSLYHLAATAALVGAFALPLAASAATAGDASQTELRTTIRSAILADPRAASMSSVQIDAMVDVLTEQAQKQGVTSHDILWRPTVPAPPAEEGSIRLFGVPFLESCGDSASVLCQLNHALGLDGSNILIPAILGAAALVLLIVIVLLIAHHRKHGVVITERTPPPLF